MLTLRCGQTVYTFVTPVTITAGHYAGCTGFVVAEPPEGWEWYTVKVVGFTPDWQGRGKIVELALRSDEFTS